MVKTKRKNYTLAENLKIVEKVRNCASKASSFRESGISEGTMRG
jgi:hypothetical protein